jgi:SAM-dependent methyltransferase
MTKKIITRFKYILRFVLSDRRRKYLKHIAGEKTYSQAGQDVLAILANKRKRDGFYIEFGAQDPIKDNNTFLLESDYGWHGLSFELKEELVSYFNWSRKNLCIQGDAAEFDYKELFLKHNVPRVVDYLQVDIEPAEASLEVLKKLPFDSYQFSVITFEHDRYASGDAVMMESRRFLKERGYFLIAANVKHNMNDFEDWWVAGDLCKINNIGQLKLSGLDFSIMIERLSRELEE